MESTGDQEDLFNLGKDKQIEVEKKKKKKADEVGEERLKNTFNVGGTGQKDNDEHKRKREEFAV